MLRNQPSLVRQIFADLFFQVGSLALNTGCTIRECISKLLDEESMYLKKKVESLIIKLQVFYFEKKCSCLSKLEQVNQEF